MEPSTETELLDRHITLARERLGQLRESATDTNGSKENLLNLAFEEFSTALEELSVAETELRQQNDVLIETRSEVEAARYRYQELFEFAPEAYLVTDRFGSILEANNAAHSLLGSDRARVTVRLLAGFIPPSGRITFRAHLSQIASTSNAKANFTLPMQCRNGRVFDAEAVVSVADTPHSERTLRWMIRDVSERNRMEEQVRRANLDLEERVRARTSELTVAHELYNRMLIAEQQARQHAEDRQRSATSLAEAGVLLSESLNLEETLSSLSRMMTDQFADWCVVYAAEGSEPQVVAVHHRDLALDPAIREASAHSFNPEIHADLIRVLAAGESVFRREVNSEIARSIIIAPLQARGQTLGVICLGTTGDRHFAEGDVGFAEQIARRAGVAVDNARLYRLAQTQLAERHRAEERAHTFNRQLQRGMIETHHRVKNNLQLIIAMIDLRLMDNPSTVSVDDMRRLGNQISIMARVHDLLTSRSEEEPMAPVPVGPVIDGLLAMLRRAADGRKIEYHGEDVSLPSRQLSALALIVNELVSNALKHSEGSVEVSIDRVTVNRNALVRVQVCDGGPGFPDGFDPHTSSNIGLELVQTLSRWDLSGEIEFSTRDEGGARVVVTFPESI